MSAKVSCTVLRGGKSGDTRTLPDTFPRAKRPVELFLSFLTYLLLS
jgi:hypothetical protein